MALAMQKIEVMDKRYTVNHVQVYTGIASDKM